MSERELVLAMTPGMTGLLFSPDASPTLFYLCEIFTNTRLQSYGVDSPLVISFLHFVCGFSVSEIARRLSENQPDTTRQDVKQEEVFFQKTGCWEKNKHRKRQAAAGSKFSATALLVEKTLLSALRAEEQNKPHLRRLIPKMNANLGNTLEITKLSVSLTGRYAGFGYVCLFFLFLACKGILSDTERLPLWDSMAASRRAKPAGTTG